MPGVRQCADAEDKSITKTGELHLRSFLSIREDGLLGEENDNEQHETWALAVSHGITTNQRQDPKEHGWCPVSGGIRPK